jgi:PAS domain S-box-containing protein
MTQQQLSVLIIDDSPEDRETYRRYLLEDVAQTYRILTAQTGEDGLALCEQQAIDGILLDFSLPDLDGLEFLSVLKQQHHRNCPPVVMITGQGNEALAVKAIKNGAEDYLVKGETKPDKLRLVMHNAIENAQLHQQLQTSEEMFRISVENMLDCFGIYSAIRDESGQIIDFQIDYLNAAALASNRMTKENIGQRLGELLPVYFECGLFNSHCQVVETGEPLIKESLIYTDVFGSDRLTRFYDIRASKLGDGFVCSWRDITEQKHKEIALHKQEEHLRLAIEAAKLGTWELDLATQKLIQSEGAAQIFGLPKGVSYQTLTECRSCVHPDDLERVNSELQDAIAGNSQYDTEYRIVLPDGKTRWIAPKGAIQRDAAGTPIRALGVVLDITERQQAEEQLQESQRFIAQIAEAVPGILYVYDLIENRNVYVNHQVGEVLGYSQEQIQAMGGQLFVTLVHPDDLAVIPAHIQQFYDAEDGDVLEIEYRMQHANGEWRWFFGREVVFKRTAQGMPQQILGIVQDITERKQAEVALRQSEARLKQLVELNLLGVVFWDADGSVLDANDAFLNMVGYTRADLEAGRVNWRKMTPCEQLEWSDRSLAQMQSKTSATLEKEYIRADGTRIPILLGGVMFAGQKNRGVSFVVDLTERQQLEEDLRRRERQFSSLVENLPDVIFRLDSNLRHLYICPQGQRVSGIARQDFLGKTGRELGLPADACDKFEAACHEAIASQKATKVEYSINSRHYSSRIIPEYAPDGSLESLLGITEDISERKQWEQEREALLARETAARQQAETANNVKDQFLAILSHELRSPLNPILGWSRLLKTRSFDSATTTKALDTIERNAQLQIQLIDDLLDVSRILRGKLTLTMAPVNLASVIEAATETMRLSAEAKSISLRMQLEPNIGNISGDFNRLQQVIGNLLSNAIKFTPNGGRVEVKLETVGEETGRGAGCRVHGGETSPMPGALSALAYYYAQITISDTGKGISSEFLPYVFEYFRQADSSTTRNFGGLGLGLAIVRHLVELHHGTVSADSPGEGLGATFTVRLPLCQTPVQLQPDNSPPQATPDLSGLKILVVDDDADTREFLCFLLKQYKASVTDAASAWEALALLQKSVPDILLSDIGMPEMDGYGLIRQIRTLSTQQVRDIPAIALTAYAGDTYKQQVLAAGFNEHLAKPVDAQQLVAVIGEIISNS